MVDLLIYLFIEILIFLNWYIFWFMYFWLIDLYQDDQFIAQYLS